MDSKNKLEWLPEVTKDMVDFCRENGLSASQESLWSAYQVILAEISTDSHAIASRDKSPNALSKKPVRDSNHVRSKVIPLM
jgi:hypothetical protein